MRNHILPSIAYLCIATSEELQGKHILHPLYEVSVSAWSCLDFLLWRTCLEGSRSLIELILASEEDLRGNPCLVRFSATSCNLAR